jgi:hypothetical protein
MSDPHGYLRICAGCGKYLRTYVTHADDRSWCDKCRTGLAVVAEPGGVVRLYGQPEWTRYCVLGRDGDSVMVRRLGFPDAEKFEVRVALVMPEFEYSLITKGARR